MSSGVVLTAILVWLLATLDGGRPGLRKSKLFLELFLLVSPRLLGVLKGLVGRLCFPLSSAPALFLLAH